MNVSSIKEFRDAEKSYDKWRAANKGFVSGTLPEIIVTQPFGGETDVTNSKENSASIY